MNQSVSASTKDVHQTTIEWIHRRGINESQIAELTLYLQKDFFPDLTLEECLVNVEKVLEKREVQNAVLTGIQLDILAESGSLIEPLQDMIVRDESLYGIDEVLSIAILNVYGSIGLTNYGYIDRVKPGILAKLNSRTDGEIHTFLDDLAGAIAAAAASRIAHNRQQ
ncbi:phosphatidylglycerophosphatase A [Thermoactinomyces sp. DSM 45892]|uniref:phosphatidylglycerophosphatase A family protein n=1 Tax=Thermoactinomyces sp. DSM 45892 TaxID=1882753 RepID=UPI000899AF62|nr:phosphatidylglycerophosphatase A [Thermoactinomyces sp. DSM 45892]SDZ37081.1 Phosphatidylglycerophosphatase A [Thermoactinomyces sp. DSM 45892]